MVFIFVAILLIKSIAANCESRTILYVSSLNGINTGSCKTVDDQCLSLTLAFAQIDDEAKVDIVVDSTTHVEGSTIYVPNKTLDVQGSDQKDSIIKKTSNGEFLFEISHSTTFLTLANLTVILSGGTDPETAANLVRVTDAAATVVLRSCSITSEGSTFLVYGHAITINSPNAFLSIYGCTIHSIDTIGGSLIHVENVDKLSIVGSSFSRIGVYSCVQVNSANIILLMDTLFVHDSAGAVYVVGLRTEMTVKSCGFWWITEGAKNAATLFGALYIHGVAVSSAPVSVTISSSSFFLCNGEISSGAVDVGGVKNGGIFYGETILEVEGCSFQNCSAVSVSGGALSADVLCKPTLSRSTFINCWSDQYGGAVYYGATDFDIQFLGGNQDIFMTVQNCVFANNKVFDSDGDGGDFPEGRDITVMLNVHFSGYNPLVGTGIYTSSNDSGVYVPNSYGTVWLFYQDSQEFPGTSGVDEFVCNPPTDNDECQMPCANDAGQCVSVIGCQHGFNALVGYCAAACLFDNQYTAVCDQGPKPCLYNYNLGYGACTVDSLSRSGSCTSTAFHRGDVTSKGRLCAQVRGSNLHYMLDDDQENEGKFVLKPCEDRVMNTLIFNAPCGLSDCYWDQGCGSKCSVDCNSTSYTHANLLTHTCEPPDLCNTVPISPRSPYCGNIDGEVCYLDITFESAPVFVVNSTAVPAEAICRRYCTDPYYGFNQNQKRCTRTECIERESVTSNSVWPCGYWNETTKCYYDPEGEVQCNISCSNTDHYTENMVNGICEMKSCLNRKSIVTNKTWPCGEDVAGEFKCYYDGLYEDGAKENKYCVYQTGCSNPAHYEGNMSTGYCGLKDCVSRTKNSSDFPPELWCGELDCVWNGVVCEKKICPPEVSIHLYVLENATTLSDAYLYGISTGAETIDISVSSGEYKEDKEVTDGLSIAGAVTIVGEGQHYTTISKTNNVGYYFSLNNDSASLTLSSLHAILYPNRGCRLINVSAAASVIIRSSTIHYDGTTRFIGDVIYLNDQLATFGLYGSRIYDILTDPVGGHFIYAVNINVLTIIGSSFAHVKYAPPITLLSVNDVVLTETLFTRSTGGVDVGGLKNSFTASFCGFWDLGIGSATIGGLAIRVDITVSSDIFVTVTNSTFMRLESNRGGGGGISVTGSKVLGDVIFTLSDSSFRSCLSASTGSGGGALNVGPWVTAEITRCSFTECESYYCGGAIYYGGLNSNPVSDSLFESKRKMTIIDCVFLNNWDSRDPDEPENDIVVYVPRSSNAEHLELREVYSGSYDASVNPVNYTHLSNTIIIIDVNETVYDLRNGLNLDDFTCSPPDKEKCRVPCAYDDNYGTPRCIKAHESSTGFNAFNGVFAPICLLYGNEGTYLYNCDANNQTCFQDKNLGYDECTVDPPTPSNISAMCDEGLDYHHKGDVTSQGRLCHWETCDIDQEEVDPVTGKCVSKPCNRRRKNNNKPGYPCGSNCYWDKGYKLPTCDGANDRCIDYETWCTSYGIYTKEETNHSCELDDCPGRDVNESQAVWKCGSGCYRDFKGPTSTQDELPVFCRESCSDPHHTGNTTTGDCELKNCEERVISSETLPWPCGWDEEESPKCYADGTSCTMACDSQYHYTEDDISGRCVLRPCGNRTVLGNSTWRCGDRAESTKCYEDFDSSCTEVCSNRDHYEPDENGRCVLKRCALRVPRPADDYSCGLDNKTTGEASCFQDVGGDDTRCVEKCTISYYHPYVNNGTCILDTCEDRTPSFELSEGFPCGEDLCFQDIGSDDPNKCVKSCTNSAHYETNAEISGKCIIKNCSNRVRSNTTDYPCGLDNSAESEPSCFQDIGGDPNVCVESCSTPEHYEGNIVSGKCTIKNCTERVPLSTVPACGRNSDDEFGLTCFQDIGYNESTCVPSCTTWKHYESDSTTGKCIIRSCTDRLPMNYSTSGPVFRACGLDIEAGELNASCFEDVGSLNQSVCVQSCTNTDHYEVSEEGYLTGRCTEKDCLHRTSTNQYDSTKPCGSGNCYFDQGKEVDPRTWCTNDTQNDRNGCTNYFHFSHQNTTNQTCLLLPCNERRANTSGNWPCGNYSEDPRCFQDVGVDDKDDPGKCVTVCSAWHWTNVTVEGHGTGKCVLKSCESRTPDPSKSDWACMDRADNFADNSSLCFQDFGSLGSQTCVTSCTVIHFEPNPDNGTCVPKECQERSPDPSGQYPCEIWTVTPQCFQDIGNDDSQCVTECSNSAHYESSQSTGRCTEKQCERRTENSTGGKAPCGSGDCYLTETKLCSETCNNPDHYFRNNDTHKCEPRECSNRRAHGNGSFPCGEDETNRCFQDIGGEDENACVRSCTNSAHYENLTDTAKTTGKCTPRPCASRGVNITGDNVFTPCGPDECYLDQGNEERENDTCAENCTNPNHYSYVDSRFKTCVLLSCSRRTPNDVLTGPCGNPAENPQCFQDVGRDSGKCAGSCTNKAHYEESTQDGICIPKSCVERVVNTNWGNENTSCGPGECYYDQGDENATNACNTVCSNSGHYTYVNSLNNTCELKPCGIRTANGSASWPCGKPGENPQCFEDVGGPVKGICVTNETGSGCSNSAHYHISLSGIPNSLDTGKCIGKTCTERTLNRTTGIPNEPCGPGECYYDPNIGDSNISACSTSCTNENHYEADNNTHECVLKECVLRTPNGTGNWPCTQSDGFIGWCFQDIGGDPSKCVESCTNYVHYFSIPDTEATGKCIPKECEDRVVDIIVSNNPYSPCGPGACYFDQGTLSENKTCKPTCTNPKHYVPQESNHSCILLECVNRTANGSAEWSCGNNDGCYQDIGGLDANACVENCTNSEHYKVNPNSGLCEERGCAERSVNNDPKEPCGPKDCYYDQGSGDPTRCASSCTNPNHYSHIGSTNNTCLLKNCSERTSNSTAPWLLSWSCGWAGEDTLCFSDIGGSDQLRCVESCSNSFFIENSTTGNCEILSCNLRTPVSSDQPACGIDRNYESTPSCFQDIGANSSVCVTNCSNWAHYISTSQGALDSGTCVIRECEDRLPSTEFSAYPCDSNETGPSCFQDNVDGELNRCVRSCSIEEHYESTGPQALFTGKCQIKECEKRTPLDRDDGPACGVEGYTETITSPTCFQDIGGNSSECVVSCRTWQHYENNSEVAKSSGKCTLRPCTDRSAVDSTPYACGLGNETYASCFQDIGGYYPTRCVEACTNVSWYREDPSTGKCVYKNCSDRLPSADAPFPCGLDGPGGDATCFQDIGGNSNTCVDSDGCTNFLNYVTDSDEARSTGKCTIKGCTERVPPIRLGDNNTDEVDWPCGFLSEPVKCVLNNPNDTLATKCVTSCSNSAHYESTSYEVVLSGKCALRSCQDRIVNTTGNDFNPSHPCGPGYCYWDVGGPLYPESNRCRTICSNLPHYDPVDEENNFTCLLKECLDRTANNSALWPCGDPDKELCFQDIGGPDADKCVYNCTNTEHFGNNWNSGTNPPSYTGRCTELPCGSRIPNGSGTVPCGSGNCFVDKGASSVNGEYPCTEQCSNPNHFTPNSVNHACEEVACSLRIPNPPTSDYPYPCHRPNGTGDPDCYQDTGGNPNVCVTACSNPYYEVNNDMGTCTIKSCTSRPLNTFNTTHPCGEDGPDGVKCYWDRNATYPATTDCNTYCSNPHYEITNPNLRVCVLLPCTARTADNDSSSWPCGSRTGDPPLCFQDVGGANPSACVTSCTNPAHYENTSSIALENGTCTEKACASRVVNYTTKYPQQPCGSGECYYDLGNTVTPNSCSETCTNENYYGKHPQDHTCILKACPSRIPIENIAQWPCGETDSCYVTSGGTCVSDCPQPTFPENTNGSCVLDDCYDFNETVCELQRISYANHSYPCLWINESCSSAALICADRSSTNCTNSTIAGGQCIWTMIQGKGTCTYRPYDGCNNLSMDLCLSNNGGTVIGGCRWNGTCMPKQACSDYLNEPSCDEAYPELNCEWSNSTNPPSCIVDLKCIHFSGNGPNNQTNCELAAVRGGCKWIAGNHTCTPKTVCWDYEYESQCTRLVLNGTCLWTGWECIPRSGAGTGSAMERMMAAVRGNARHPGVLTFLIALGTIVVVVFVLVIVGVSYLKRKNTKANDSKGEAAEEKKKKREGGSAVVKGTEAEHVPTQVEEDSTDISDSSDEGN